MSWPESIAVVGCGALGSYYGARLTRSNKRVHFLLRSDYEVVRRQGIQVLSPEGDFRVQPRAARDPADIGPVDLVLIGLKTTANGRFAELLPPLVGPETAVLTLQNGLGNEERLARLFPRSQILGGLCFVCLNRLEPGRIAHLAHGLVVMGELSGWPEPRTHELAGCFRQAGIPCKVTDNLRRAHWEKLVWNIPFNGLGVAACAGLEALEGGSIPEPDKRGPCLATDALLGDPGWEGWVRGLMDEVIGAARCLGLEVDPALAARQMANTRTMGAYRASTLIDYERGQPLELEGLFREPLRQAREAGLEMSRLAALVRVLERLDPGVGASE